MQSMTSSVSSRRSALAKGFTAIQTLQAECQWWTAHDEMIVAMHYYAYHVIS